MIPMLLCPMEQYIYCTGSSPNEDRQHNVYSYDIKSNQWKQLPRPGHFFGVIHMIDDKLTIFGGMDSTTYNIHNKVTTYNNKTNSWYRCYPDMLRKRYRPGVITSHDYMIVMGGKSGPYTVLNRIELMDYRDKLQWKEVSIHLPEPMWAIKPTISGGYITIVGYSNTRGRNKGYYHIAAKELFSSLDQPLATPRWKRVSIAMHYDTTVVPHSNPPVVIGGGSRGGIVLTSNITLYDAAKKLWIKVASLSSARDCVGVAMLNDNAMIIIGGTRGRETVEGALASSLTTVEIGSIVPNK